MSRYVIGIDAGTESIRAAVFDEKGICLSFGASDNKTVQHIRGGQNSQSPSGINQ